MVINKMPYQVSTINDYDNVILVTYTGEMTAQDVSESVAELVEVVKSMPRPVYQIGDFRLATGTFGTVLRITHTFPSMLRIYKEEKIIGPIVVNQFDNRWLLLSLILLDKMNITRFTIFETIEAALDYILQQSNAYEV